MSLYDEPRNVLKHLAELEDRWTSSHHRHQSGELRGWRKERHLAAVREASARDRDPKPSSNILGRLIAMLPKSGRRTRQIR